MKKTKCANCSLKFLRLACPTGRDNDAKYCPSCDPFLTTEQESLCASANVCKFCPNFKKCLTIDFREKPRLVIGIDTPAFLTVQKSRYNPTAPKPSCGACDAGLPQVNMRQLLNADVVLGIDKLEATIFF